MPFVDLDKIIVTGTYLMFDETAAAGSISFTPEADLREVRDPAGNQIIVPNQISASFDGTGHFSVTLPASNDPDVDPTNWTYHVVVTIPARSGNRTDEFDVSIPYTAAGGTIDMADLTPVSPLGGFSSYALEADFLLLEARVAALEAAGFLVAGEAIFSKAGTAVVAVGVSRWYAPVNLTIGRVIISAGIAPTGTDFIADLKLDGTTVFTTGANRPKLVSGDNEMETVAPDVVFVPQGHYLTADIVQIGSTFAGSDVNLQVIFA